MLGLINQACDGPSIQYSYSMEQEQFRFAIGSFHMLYKFIGCVVMAVTTYTDSRFVINNVMGKCCLNTLYTNL